MYIAIKSDHYLHAVQISPAADGFHLAYQDLICHQANFIARTHAPGVVVGEGCCGGLSEVSEENYLLIVKLCVTMYFPCLHLPKSMYLKCATGIKRFVSFVTVARRAEVSKLEVHKSITNR